MPSLTATTVFSFDVCAIGFRCVLLDSNEMILHLHLSSEHGRTFDSHSLTISPLRREQSSRSADGRMSPLSVFPLTPGESNGEGRTSIPYPVFPLPEGRPPESQIWQTALSYETISGLFNVRSASVVARRPQRTDEWSMT